ncbi:hypothetical protein BJX63DRAFT_432837 [Aspergillus granulosus]|uniref:Uncharacterized protein n=1 Tax=Aspergillus granulosus TaxID=176169 RepID=A0ABR4H9S2_9EURO
MSPEREIYNTLKLDDPQALREALLNIRPTIRKYDLIELALYEAASNGYFESYQLVVDWVLERAADIKWSMRIPPAIRASIRKGHHDIAEDLIMKVLALPCNNSRQLLIICAFQCAVQADYISIVKRILLENISYADLSKAMRSAAERCNIEAATLLLDDLLDMNKSRIRAIAGKTNAEEIEQNVRLSQAQCLMVGLSSAIKAKAHAIATLLLQPFLECLERINPVSHENCKKTEIFTNIEDDVHLMLGRKECKKFLESGIPVFAGKRVARCLKMDSL